MLKKDLLNKLSKCKKEELEHALDYINTQRKDESHWIGIAQGKIPMPAGMSITTEEEMNSGVDMDCNSIPAKLINYET